MQCCALDFLQDSRIRVQAIVWPSSPFKNLYIKVRVQGFCKVIEFSIFHPLSFVSPSRFDDWYKFSRANWYSSLKACWCIYFKEISSLSSLLYEIFAYFETSQRIPVMSFQMLWALIGSNQRWFDWLRAPSNKHLFENMPEITYSLLCIWYSFCKVWW